MTIHNFSRGGLCKYYSVDICVFFTNSGLLKRSQLVFSNKIIRLKTRNVPELDNVPGMFNLVVYKGNSKVVFLMKTTVFSAKFSLEIIFDESVKR